MKDIIRTVLQKIKDERGNSIFTKPEFKGAVLDTWPENEAKKYRKILIDAMCDMDAYTYWFW
jgi:hypothetical protein